MPSKRDTIIAIMKNNRIIFHVDLDAFFASCEERENPQFRGKPVVVGADPRQGKGRGVVSTANYRARKFGIHSAMPISRAWRLCPAAIFLPVNGGLYSKVSRSVMRILQDTARNYKGAFEQVSIDEACIDLSQLKTFSHCEKIARSIKKQIVQLEKITASIGIGPNMLIAKIASDFQKPDGLTIIGRSGVQKFLDPLSVRKLPGIGPKTEMELARLGIQTVTDLRKIPQSVLYEQFGQHGISLYESARGIDARAVATKSETKSISEEHTFTQDTNNPQKILPILFSLVPNVLHTMTLEGYQNFRTITIKVRYADFETHTKAQSGDYSTKDTQTIEKIALQLFWAFTAQNKKVRLIGFRVSGFE